MRRLTLVHLPSHDALRVLDGNPPLPPFNENDGGNYRDHEDAKEQDHEDRLFARP